MFLQKRIKYTREIFSAKDTKTLLANFFSLGIIQGTNFILPLILLPYLIHVLGFDKFGLVTMAQSFVSFWIIFTDYGFHISATKEVALHKNDKEKLAVIVNHTLQTKLLLCLAAFSLYLLTVLLVPAFSKYSVFYLLTFFMVIGQSLVPTWFFQGMEKMHFLTYTNFISKTVFTLLIFLVIKQPSDYRFVTLLYGMGNLIAGIAGTVFMFRKFSLPCRLFEKFDFRAELKKGWYVFVSNFSINTYLNLNTLILGLFAGEMAVGFYSAAEKVVYAVKMLITIFFQATFPKVCLLKEKGIRHLNDFFRRYFVPFALLIVLLSTFIFLSADWITVLLTKKAMPEVAGAIRLLSVVPVLVCLNTPAAQTLLAYNLQKTYMLVLLAGSCLNIALNLLLVKYLLITGTIICIIATEALITGGLFLILHLKHYQYSPLRFKLGKAN